MKYIKSDIPWLSSPGAIGQCRLPFEADRCAMP